MPLLTIIASHLELYTLLERLVLFLIPFFLLIIGIGIESVWERVPRYARWLIVGIFCVSMVNKDGYRFFYQKMEFEDTKTILSRLKADIQPNDFIFVEHNAVPAFIFYNNLHQKSFQLPNAFYGKWDTDVAKVLKTEAERHPNNQFWLIFAHTAPQDIEKTLSNIRLVGTENLYFEAVGASIYQLHLKNN